MDHLYRAFKFQNTNLKIINPCARAVFAMMREINQYIDLFLLDPGDPRDYMTCRWGGQKKEERGPSTRENATGEEKEVRGQEVIL